MGNKGLIPTFFVYSVVGDTHAANLTGSYSASSDTHALGGSESVGTIQSGKDAEGSAVGGVNGTSVTTDNADHNVATCSVTATTNTKQVIAMAIASCNTTVSGTLKLKRGSTTLASASGLPQAKVILTSVDTGFSVGANTYALAGVQSGGTMTVSGGVVAVNVEDSHALTGSYTASSDTHAAQLTGSSGTCQI